MNEYAKITPTDIEAIIVNEYYFTAMDGAWGARMNETILNLGQVVSMVNPFEPKRQVPDQTDEISEFKPRKELNDITICVMILANGFKVVGINEGPVSPKNFDAKVGRQLARQKAIDQIWALEGYLLKEKINDRTLTVKD